jgi:hypothetical protein
LPGLSWEAEAGAITAPLISNNGNIYQTIEAEVPSGSGLASYEFNINQAGNYIIRIFVNAADDGKNSIFLNIDDEPASPAMVWDIILTSGFENRTVSWRGSGTPTSNEYVPKRFALSAGQHELIIRGREPNTLLDKIRIERFGDVNKDGNVDLTDIREMIKDYGKTGGFANNDADVNLDGSVSLKDLIHIAKNLG